MTKYYLTTCILFFYIASAFAQSSGDTASTESQSARGKLTDTISQVIQALGSKDFQLGITEADKSSIVQNGQEFSIPKSLRLKALLNLPILIKDTVVRRILKAGQPYGYKLSEIKAGSIFNSLGLRSGDILRTVDGQFITTEKEALDVFNSVKLKSEVSVMLERSSREVAYVYKFI